MPTGTSTIAPVRLTVSPSLMVAVVAEDHDADIVGFEVQRHAPDAAGKFDHFAGLHIVETINAGDTVAHGEHLPDLRYFCFLTEIFDLLFEDRRNLGRADFHELHQLASFIAFSRFLSFVRKDVSIIWLPTFTMRPPRSLGSTVTVSFGLFPSSAAAYLSRSCDWAFVKGNAEMISASTSPRSFADSALKDLNDGLNGK